MLCVRCLLLPPLLSLLLLLPPPPLPHAPTCYPPPLLQDTVNAIITASGLPLSVLIVGIGNADFSSMEALDADKKKLTLKGRVAERDIVQVGGEWVSGHQVVGVQDTLGAAWGGTGCC